MRLVVVDGYKRGLRQALAPAQTRLLVLHRPPQVVIDSARRRGLDLAPDIFVSIVPLAEKARRALKEFVPRFYAGFPFRKDEHGGSLIEELFPDEPASWWLTDMSEKSVFRGALISRLYSLALLSEAVESYRPSEVWICLSDNRLAAVMAESLRCASKVRIGCGGWLPARIRTALQGMSDKVLYPCRALAVAWGTLAEFVMLKLLRTSPVTDPGQRALNRVALFSFFPGWWKQPWDHSQRREVFYQDLPRTMSARGLAVQYVIWLRLGMLALLRHAAAIRRLCDSGDVLCLQSLCEWRAGRQLFGLMPLRYCRRAWKTRLHSTDVMFKGFDIQTLVRTELLQTVSNREFFRNLLLRSAIKKLPEFDLFLFRVEFQPFERAILQGLEGRDTVTVGYQHSTVGEDYLSHVFTHGQIQKSDGNSAAPLAVPDYIVTTGGHVAQLMQQNGFRPQQIHVAGPLRYQALRRRLSTGKDLWSKKIRDRDGRYDLLVPVSLNRSEATGFAAVLGEALIGTERRFTVSIKGHPANNHARAFLAHLLSKTHGLIARVVPDDADLYDCIDKARALVMTGSTVGLEAIALGTPVIMFASDHMFSFTASSLNAIGRAVVRVNDVASLQQSLRRVYEEELPFSEARAFWPQAVKTMFHDLELDPDEKFCEIIGKILDRDARRSTAGTVT